MWKTHCLRLTRDLRAGARHAPNLLRAYSLGVGTAAPISTEEFWQAFTAIWPYPRKADAPRIGLAVSGGVDSMALASLCSKASRQYDRFPECVGLIVDHKSRQGSSEEALWVAEQLRTHAGMSSFIIPLQWPEAPNELTNFETQARRLRYRALGLACREHDLMSLLVGHHADDQAETVMLRLIAGRVRTGLRGIQAVKEIPECYGLYGVHQSGGLDRLPEPTTSEYQNKWIKIETGGIKVVRPLLQFPKERLIATCLGNEIQWTEDHTNHDKTLTDRNAIRHILQDRQLPSALQRDSLIRLCQRIQQRVDDGAEAAEGLFELCNMKLDVRSGILRVDFSKAGETIDKLAATDEQLAKNIAISLVGRLVALVSQRASPRMDSFNIAVEALFPIFQAEKELGRPKTITAGGALFLPDTTEQAYDASSRTITWVLGRQPIHKTYDLPPRLDVPPGNSFTSIEYQMFDGRFWLRVVNPTDYSVTIRLLHKDDLPYISKPLKDAIKSLVPNNLRETLPVLTRFDEGGREQIIALPTLGMRIGRRGSMDGIKWTTRYKKIDLGKHDLDQVIDRRGISDTRAELIAEKNRERMRTLMKARSKGARSSKSFGNKASAFIFTRSLEDTRRRE